MKFLGQHWQDETWHEVLRLICGMIDETFVGQLVDWLIQQEISPYEHLNDNDRLQKEALINLCLSAECLMEVRESTALQHIANKLLKKLRDLAETEYPYRFDGDTATAVLHAMTKIWTAKNQLIDWLERCVDFDEQSLLPGASVAVLIEADQKRCSRKTWLKELAANHYNSAVRRAAVQKLAHGWKDETDTLDWLKQRAQSDEDYYVRFAAVQELARSWKDETDTLSILKQRAQSDEYSTVRRAAVQEIARSWKDETDTLDWLKQRAQSDEDYYVRRAVVQELARGWKDETDTLDWLKQCAQSDEDYYVRRAVVQELARGWKDETDTLDWLKQCAQDEKFKQWAQRKLQQLTPSPDSTNPNLN